MGRFTDSSTIAEESGNLKISKKMLKAACPIMFGCFGIKQRYSTTYKRMCEYMALGDTQPAVVYSLSPFLVAAYSDEMDAVVMVRFDEILTSKYNIIKGQRMISVNIYTDGKRFDIEIPKDITIGPGYLNRWTDFCPHIGDLLSDDIKIIDNHKMNIPENKWLHVERLAEEYEKNNPGIFRDGSHGIVEFK